jgi:hypothetical protein
VAVTPGLRSPIARLANYDSDGPDPHYDVPVDGDALRRAGALLPGDAMYFVYAPGAGPVEAGNLGAAAELFFLPGVPVARPADAGWVLSYHASGELPAGAEAARTRRVGDDVYLVELG